MAGRKKVYTEKTDSEKRMAKIAAQKRKRKRRRAAVLVLVPLLVLSFIGYYLINYFFCIESFEVQGDSRYAAEEIVAASTAKQGDKLVLLSKKQMEASILAALPYIGEAKIKRTLPSTLTFEVKDTYPIAMVEAGDVCYLFDKNFKVLEIVSIDTELSIPRMDSNAVADEPQIGKKLAFLDDISGKIYVDILDILTNNNLLGRIQYIDASDKLSIKLQYDNRIIIDLGNYLDLSEKISLGTTVIQDKLAPSDRGKLNVYSAKKVSFLPRADIEMLTDRQKT